MNKKQKFVNLHFKMDASNHAELEFYISGNNAASSNILFVFKQGAPSTTEFHARLPVECVAVETWINLCHKNGK
jgi:hypothetical protein